LHFAVVYDEKQYLSGFWHHFNQFIGINLMTLVPQIVILQTTLGSLCCGIGNSNSTLWTRIELVRCVD